MDFGRVHFTQKPNSLSRENPTLGSDQRAGEITSHRAASGAVRRPLAMAQGRCISHQMAPRRHREGRLKQKQRFPNGDAISHGFHARKGRKCPEQGRFRKLENEKPLFGLLNRIHEAKKMGSAESPFGIYL